MNKLKSVIVAILVAGSMAVQAEAGDQGINGLLVGAAGGALVGQAMDWDANGILQPSSPSPDLASSFGGWQDHRSYRPNVRCKDVVFVECWHGRCRDVVKTVCREREWRGDRYWHGDRDWHDRDWRDRDWRDRDRWRDRYRHDGRG